MDSKTNGNFWKYLLFAVLLLLSVAHVTYRHIFIKRIPPEMYSGTLAERLETWNNMKRLSLSDDDISTFVNNIFTSETLSPPNGTTKISMDNLTEEQKDDIRQAVEGFFRAYREKTSEVAFDFLTVSRGATNFIPEIKKNVQDSVRQSGESVSLDTDKDIFMYVWDKGSQGIGWASILDKSGQYCVWKTHIPLNADQTIQMILEEPNLFGNTTAMPHLFTVSLELDNLLKQGKSVLFSDIFFVTELTKEKECEFCAGGIRFWFNEENKKWIPNMFIITTPNPRQDIQVPF